MGPAWLQRTGHSEWADPVLRKLPGHGNGRSRTGSMGEVPLGMVAQVGVGR